MIDFSNISNIKLPIYSNKYGQGDYLELIDDLSKRISEFRHEPRRPEKNAIMERMALRLIVFYSEWYRRDYVGGKGSQQWEGPLIDKRICTKSEFSEIRPFLVKKVGEQYGILAKRHDLADNNGQLLRSILCQGGLPIEYILHGPENNSFFTLLHWIVSESLNNETPNIREIKARTEQLRMPTTLTGIDTCKATLALAESITAEAVVPFNVSESTLKELESKLKEDRERVKKLGLNRPIFFKEFFIEQNPDGGFDFKYTIRLEESFSVERAYRFGLSLDVQRFTVSHKGDSLGRYIRMGDGLFHRREFQNKPVFSETDGSDECNQVDIKTDLSDYHCELVSKLSFTGENILLTELKNGVWLVKNRFNDEGTFYVWVPETYTVNAEDGSVSECCLGGCNYYRVLINQRHLATLYSPEGKQLDPHHLFLTDYTVSFHGLTSSWLLASNVNIISDLPDDYNIQIYDNINQKREFKYSVKYRVKNEKEYHDISSSLPEGIVFIRVDVGYQQVEGRFFYAKGLDCEIDTHKQAICWAKSGDCEIISDSTDIDEVESEPGVFSLRNKATVRTIGFQIKANKDTAFIEAPAPTNNIRVLDVDGNLLRSGQSICIQNLHYYNVYSPGKGKTRVSITSSRFETPNIFTKRLPFKSSLSDFKRDIESVYYAETMSPLNNTCDYVELSFPDSVLSFKCVYYNRLAEPDDANRILKVIDTGYREDESITGLYYVTLDCDPDDIAIGELNQSEDKKFHYPEVNSSIMVLPRLDGNINLVRPTLLISSSKETNWQEEIMSSCSPQDGVWKKLHRYYDVCRQYAIPFDVFNCFQAICGKYVKNFDGKIAAVCPPEEYQTYVSRFALSMLCEYNTPVDDFLLKFARCFNFMWHWISMDKWEKALAWGGFNYLKVFIPQLSQLISEELCLPSTNQPIKCTHYIDFGYEEFSIDHMSLGEIFNGSYEHIATSFNDFISRIRPLVENTFAIQGPSINLYGDTDIINSINGIRNKGERQLFKSAYVAAALFTGKYQGRFRNPKAILYAQMNTSVYSLVFTNILRYI